jgi:hypothetical protein
MKPECIHDILNNISDNELIELYNKLINPRYIRKKILLYDLENYTPQNNETITKNDFLTYVIQLLKYYNDLFIEFYEDNIWIIHDKSSIKYPLKENEIVFENSISLVENSSYNDRGEYYIKLIRNKLNKISSKIHISTKIIEDNNNEICWILLKCTSDLFI